MEEVVGMERTACKRPRAALDGGSAAAAWRTCRVARAAGGGKDRHSKVVTARGLRDRRVRLSVPTAIQFYDIQDRLGVDQPSKAIEWLIRAAAASIDALPSLDCSLALPAPSPLPAGNDVDAEVSTSETSKGSMLSLASAPAETAAAAAQQNNPANNGGAVGGAFAELLNCATNDDKSMQQKEQPTLTYYAAQIPNSYIMPAMPLETMPHLAFLQEQQQPVVVFDRGTLQSNAVAAPLGPRTQHPYLLQRFSSASADAAGLPFFLGDGAAPATSTSDRGLQFWNFKHERKT
jgi:hypothetical protein